MGCSATRGFFLARHHSCFFPTFTFTQGSQHRLAGARKWRQGAGYAQFRRQMRLIAGFGETGISKRHIHRMRCLVECCSSITGSDAVSSSKKPIIFVPKVSFCPSCGGATEERVPKGEHELRSICTICGCVHYQNPKMVVGCLVEHENKVLLCKRKIQPSYGLWTLPAGYMELGESAMEGAKRETMEEAEAEVEAISLFAHVDIPLIGQSYIIFRATFKRQHFSPGPESLECALFGLNEIPFDEIAFSSINVVLQMYVEDVQAGRLSMHYGVIDKRFGASPSDPRGYVLRDHLVI